MTLILIAGLVEWLHVIYHTDRNERGFWVWITASQWWFFLYFIMTSSNGNIFRVSGLLCRGNALVTVWPVNTPHHKDQWPRALMFSYICALTNSWANNGDPGDLRRHHAHYDVIVMFILKYQSSKSKTFINSIYPLSEEYKTKYYWMQGQACSVEVCRGLNNTTTADHFGVSI